MELSFSEERVSEIVIRRLLRTPPNIRLKMFFDKIISSYSY